MGLLPNKIRAIFNPEEFQGWGQKQRYFEGWYFKVVNESETKAFAFIPGIAMDNQGKSQAFIQVLDGRKKTAVYHKFPPEMFLPTRGKFEIRIGENFFSPDCIRLKLPEISGSLKFTDTVPWPNRWYSPGIMGPYSFVPFMECYHGIVSLDHQISGDLNTDGGVLNFDNGRGYTEKDWGRSFPSAYVWLQTNHFSKPGFSIKASVAKIPFLGSWFVGFIAGIWLDGKLIQFTTYNGSKLQKSLVSPEKVELVITNKNFELEIVAHQEEPTALASPILGLMEGRIEESMTATIEVNLTDRKTGELIFNDTGRNAGMEVAGKIEELIIG